ncbi:hypothetical protein TCAL_05577 [Tigriopus californicus]|uniref:legumain n=1 Tax=Tigriopus californicus TaxID=6832 RepID=A0A553NEY7_TIGCA|nr:legumain-like [Tigriopus californicus]TRY64012.1 hypothetical protein TCAL_05577 [Tigriopus californicus]|eukprot:TCALIF_05577-PA protein Name:"Similar to Lgmn Legumain (Rattus norvegicus)" AED:0.06 eAED:0.06 QI:195/1/1/1/1/1/5/74/448
MAMNSLCLVVLMMISTGLALSVPDLEAVSNEVPDGGKLWAVLVAGSMGYFNYRHQADVCHAYQILSRHGIPDENIVVMMFDDIAYNTMNPTPGKIINRPNGTNVYTGVPRDYTEDDNTPENFLSVLKGEKPTSGSGKVLGSNENDHVFVYFADHGAPGLLGFGNSILKADALIDTLQEMSEKKRYKKLVFYVEACESGSMFQNLLPDSWNIYATTASNATTSSYACYYDTDYQTFLGDVYSVKWLEDTDRENVAKETFEKQFKIVKNQTTTSEVCQFGTLDFVNDHLADFFGNKNTAPDEDAWDGFPDTCGADAVESHMVPMVSLQNRLVEAQGQEEADEIQKEMNELSARWDTIRSTVQTIVNSLVENDDDFHHVWSGTPEISERECYYAAIDTFHEQCYNLGQESFAMRLVFTFANFCEMGYKTQDIVAAIEAECAAPPQPKITLV